MKKLISLMLALIMVLSLATVASAATASTKEDSDANTTDTFTFLKKYVDENNNVLTTIPTETLSFTIEKSPANHAGPTVTIADNGADVGAENPDDIVLSVAGDCTTTGKYNYIVNEVNGTSQGVIYSTDQILVTVWVYWEDVPATEEGQEATRVLKKSVTLTKPESGEKVNTITNVYKTGDLRVKKTISGNLAASDVEFEIDVVLKTNDNLYVNTDITVSGADDNSKTVNKGWTGEITIPLKLHADEEVNIIGIPENVTYTVIEKAVHKLGANETAADPNSAKSEDYTATGEVSTATTINASADGDNATLVTINNEKSTNVQTGIVTDSAPYIILIAVCAVAAVAFILKRRNAVEF